MKALDSMCLDFGHQGIMVAGPGQFRHERCPGLHSL